MTELEKLLGKHRALTARLSGPAAAVTQAANTPTFRKFEAPWEVDGRSVSSETHADGSPKDPRHPRAFDFNRAMGDQAAYNKAKEDGSYARAMAFDQDEVKRIAAEEAEAEQTRLLAEAEAYRDKQAADKVDTAANAQMQREKATNSQWRRVSSLPPLPED